MKCLRRVAAGRQLPVLPLAMRGPHPLSAHPLSAHPLSAQRLWILALLALALLHVWPSEAAAEPVVLAERGQPRGAVRVASDAPQELLLLADELRAILSKMVQSEFRVERQLDGEGVLLVVASPPPEDPWRREAYSIRCSRGRVTLTGATPQAVEHAVWDFLHRLGYRQFFPGPNWEIIPRQDTLRIDLMVDESPDYAYRRIWYGFGLWDYNERPYRDWCRRNRMGGSVQIHSGHAYGAIIRAKQQAFDAHPEFYALVNGKRDVRPQAKLCISNPDLRSTVVAYAREHFAAHPDEHCVSMDPSDGGGWCECQACREIGTPSDRAVLLANTVADAVKPRLVGMYAYNYHSAPPSLDVHPNVCINAATAFIKGGRSIDEILRGWSEKGATLGIREYYSVNTWDRDLPGAARGSNLAYLAESIPAFHAQGARFMNSESSDNWGCNGLGYYFASRVLWDVDESQRREAIVDDFLQAAFGPAQEPMRRYYELIDGANRQARLAYEDLLARMFRQLAAARERVAAGSPEQARIDDLVLYTRYVELFDRYRRAEGPDRQAAFESLIRHAYRMRGTMMVHAKALYRDLPARDKSVRVPDSCRWSVPEDRNPWKSSQRFSESEIAGIVAAGIRDHQPLELDFEPREFGDQFAPARTIMASSAGQQPVTPGNANRGRGPRSWLSWWEQPGELVLHVTGGLITHYRDRGNVRIRVFQLGGASETGERETLVAEDASTPPDGRRRTVRIPIREPGLYRIELDDGMDMTEVTWPDGQPMTWKLALEDHPRALTGRWSLWFYVPRNTRRIGLYVDTAAGNILDPAGRSALALDHQQGRYLSVAVPPGTDGRLWKLDRIAGRVCLLNVPPYAARTGPELLLPRDSEAGRDGSAEDQ